MSKLVLWRTHYTGIAGAAASGTGSAIPQKFTQDQLVPEKERISCFSCASNPGEEVLCT
jgi:hypothetical protein